MQETTSPKTANGIGAVQSAVRQLLEWAKERRYTGTATIRVSFNQGGATSARPHAENLITDK